MSVTGHAGFSLIEVMCAILILGIALVGLTQGLTTALSSTKESELQSTAALLAAAQIETLRAEGFIAEGESEGDGEDELSLYHWRETISATSIDGLFEVAVVVENANSGEAIYELRTLLFEPPVDTTETESARGKGTERRRPRP